MLLKYTLIVTRLLLCTQHHGLAVLHLSLAHPRHPHCSGSTDSRFRPPPPAFLPCNPLPHLHQQVHVGALSLLPGILRGAPPPECAHAAWNQVGRGLSRGGCVGPGIYACVVDCHGLGVGG